MNTASRFFEYRHIVSFQETNVVGNVYFTNHLAWQGRCREMFLRTHAPDILDELDRGLSLATVNCSCEYFAELLAFDEIVVKMRLAELVQNRMRLTFEYTRGTDLVARGEQTIACMKRDGKHLSPTAMPPTLRVALEAFA